MRKRTHLTALLAVAAICLGCGPGRDAEPEEKVVAEDPRAGLKIPVSTRSDEALDLFLEGRRLTERLRAFEARHFYLQALQEDRHFALAHLALANSSTSAREFFESMERALALSEVVSEGERLLILARDAGVRGEAAEQLGYMRRLVELYPDDERAHTALGILHNNRQEWEPAIEHLLRAVEIEPDYSLPYNMLGYIYRTLGRYDKAEEAFVKYIELIPDEPNPYDSYAELLMKIGRFEESIVNYEKALEIQPDFLFSYIGIGNNLVLLERMDEARDVFDQMYEQAADVAQRRTALMWKAIAYLHENDHEAALELVSRMFALAEENDDPVSMAGDRIRMGLVLLEAGDPERALERFIDSVLLVSAAGVPQEVTDNTKREFLYWKARVDLARGLLDDARAELETYREQVTARSSPSEHRRVYELEGELALAEGDATRALDNLAQANQQDPRILLLTARAHRLAGDLTAARRSAKEAAHFNGLAANYAFVRQPALRLLEELEAAA